jgi:NAD(P)-dependent dehydrogenase (short-subunit alcohol dehydrogenase family)
VQYAHAGLAQVTPQELEDVFATNMYAYFHCAAAALPHLKAGGAIINTSSVAAYTGAPKVAGCRAGGTARDGRAS